MEMLQRTEAPEGYFAGMLTGWGGFGVDSTGEPWLFFTALHGARSRRRRGSTRAVGRARNAKAQRARDVEV
jgi:hypothetical protein